MHTIGIIAEYNPFHSGHRYHLEHLRKEYGTDCGIICVMSGNWVQRGDAALNDKWTRAQLALTGGADLILELPTVWAVSSAESFARGGVSLLNATGVVDTLSFGSEAGHLAPLQAVAEVTDSPAWQAILQENLQKGMSFPTARQNAATALLASEADCLHDANNSLGVEYLRALHHTSSHMMPHTVRRLGAGHDSHKPDTHVSASYLREQILSEHPASLIPYLTKPAEALLRHDPAALSFCTQGVLARLRLLTEADFSKLPDCTEGLGHRLEKAVREATSLPALYAMVKSKRYAHARIRRLVLWAFLGLSAESRSTTPPYLRVLGFSVRGQALLRQMKETATLPILTKPAHAKGLSKEAAALFETETQCTLLYDLCRKNFGTIDGKNEYTQNPVRL